MAIRDLKRSLGKATRALRRLAGQSEPARTPLRAPGARKSDAAPTAAKDAAVRKIADSGLIDLSYYNAQLDVDLQDRHQAAKHYISTGAKSGINPNRAFDTKWYSEYYRLSGQKTNPLVDYIDNAEKSQRNPSPAFDRAYYRKAHKDVAITGVEPLRHFVEHGQFEQRSTSPFVEHEQRETPPSERRDPDAAQNQPPTIEQNILRIVKSGLFDLEHYNRQLDTDFANIKAAARHYIETGASNGVNPNAAFDSAWYVDSYLDAGKPVNPLLDYIENAERKGRNPSPGFDRAFYLSFNRDVAATRIEPLRHFVEHGQSEGRITSPFVDEKAPTRFRSLFSEVLPQDGIITLEGNFAVKPIKESSAEVLVSDYPAARDEHDDASIRNSPIAQTYPNAPYVARFTNVAIAGGTRLILPDSHTALSDEIHAFKALPASSTRPHSYLVDKTGKLRTTLSRRYPSRIKRGIHAMHEYAGNYFHFVVEVLPRLFLADKMGLDRDIPILTQSGLAKNLRVLLDGMNVNGREIIELTERQVFQIEEIYFVSDASSIQDVYSREREPAETILHLGLLRDVVAQVLEQHSTPRSGEPRRRRIYVRRGQRYRGLRNESDVEDFLVERGFELVSTDDLSVRSQINIFRDAELILCPTGAAVTNILWCRPGTEVHVFMSDHVATPTEIWTQLGKVSGCNVNVTKCERAFSNDGKYAMHDDYYADLSTVRRIVDEFSGTSSST